MVPISIHAPRVGSDRGRAVKWHKVVISIHAPRVGSDQHTPCRVIMTAVISIHAPRVGSDLPEQQSRQAEYISIHAPRVGSDVVQVDILHRSRQFQSTLPVWGATPSNDQYRTPAFKFQSTLPVWGATAVLGPFVFVFHISIHAPRVGSDARSVSVHGCGRRFQSTLPVWGATDRQDNLSQFFRHFNPRSPCGERLPSLVSALPQIIFQSTLPVWGATRTQA